MDKIEEEIINGKQTQVDLIESGIIRVSGMLIVELADTVSDDRLTLEKVRAFHNKLDVVLEAFDKAQEDLNCSREFYARRAEKEAARQADKVGAKNDNHE